jgi:hypothetical protein
MIVKRILRMSPIVTGRIFKDGIFRYSGIFRDVVDKVYKPEYRWVLRSKNRYGYPRNIGDIPLNYSILFLYKL